MSVLTLTVSNVKDLGFEKSAEKFGGSTLT